MQCFNENAMLDPQAAHLLRHSAVSRSCNDLNCAYGCRVSVITEPVCSDAGCCIHVLCDLHLLEAASTHLPSQAHGGCNVRRPGCQMKRSRKRRKAKSR